MGELQEKSTGKEQWKSFLTEGWTAGGHLKDGAAIGPNVGLFRVLLVRNYLHVEGSKNVMVMDDDGINDQSREQSMI
jgi:hypothetical protein